MSKYAFILGLIWAGCVGQAEPIVTLELDEERSVFGTVGFGQPCTTNSDCQSSICANHNGVLYCSKGCYPPGTKPGECQGAVCYHTTVAGFYVCGKPPSIPTKDTGLTPDAGPPQPDSSPPADSTQPKKDLIQKDLTPPKSDSTSPNLTVQITYPSSGAQMSESFSVNATLSHATSPISSRLYADDVEIGSKSTLPCAFKVTLKPGPYTLRIEVTDAQNRTGSASVFITVKSTASNPKLDGKELGASCGSNEECSSGLCIFGSTTRYCSQTCDSQNPDCPTSYDCVKTEQGAAVCGRSSEITPVETEFSGESIHGAVGCQTSAEGPYAVGVVFVVLLFVLGIHSKSRKNSSRSVAKASKEASKNSAKLGAI